MRAIHSPHSQAQKRKGCSSCCVYVIIHIPICFQTVVCCSDYAKVVSFGQWTITFPYILTVRTRSFDFHDCMKTLLIIYAVMRVLVSLFAIDSYLAN